MDLPLSADNLASKPNTNIKSKIRQKKVIKHIKSITPRMTKEQDKKVLMNKLQLNPNENLSISRHIENNRLMREFNERWKKPKKSNQTLKEALFDVYVERKSSSP